MESRPRADTPDPEYSELLKSLIPSSQRECVGGAGSSSVGAEIPTAPGPDPDGEWRGPSDAFASQLARHFRICTTCRACDRKGNPSNLVFCAGCGVSHEPVHRDCLRDEAKHKPSSNADQKHCREVSFKEYAFIQWLFDASYDKKSDSSASPAKLPTTSRPPLSPSLWEENLHMDDMKTTWFGVPHDQPEAKYPQLYVWNRLRNLSSEVADAPQRQHPSLISFVSPTGSGKSTLIRALIRMLEPVAHVDFDAPVPGSIEHVFASTSSDVHLYADPRTRLRKEPLYFADCEGLSGSDDPIARRVISKKFRSTPSRTRHSDVGGFGKETSADRISYYLDTASHREDLRWGHLRYLHPATNHQQGDRGGLRSRRNSGQVDPPTRRLIVEQLYPRLLYAFSDVVCFVQNNTRVGQGMFDTLFKWASHGHEKTLNQRVLPGLIIIFNKSAEIVHGALGTPEQATRSMLEAYAKCARFKDMQRMWARRGSRVRTAEDLIHCYYHAFKVVSIPTYSSSPTVAAQTSVAIKGLYQNIREMSNCIREKRKSFNMDPDISSFDSYVKYAAGRLAQDHKAAVDFHQMQRSSGDSSLPVRFGEHLVQLMSSMAKLRKLDDSDNIGGESQLVQDIIPFIASCILAQISHPNSGERKRQTDSLVKEVRLGLQQFRDELWRCEALHPRTRRRCCNYWESHDKGHQFQSVIEPSDEPQLQLMAESASSWSLSTSEDALAVGQHESSYDGDKYIDSLWKQIHAASSEGQDSDSATKKRLADTAQDIGVSRVQSQRTCLSCLSNCPTNTLPCRGAAQHSICELCIRRYKTRHESSWAHLTQCPLGCYLETAPWKIRVKPETAGSRVLSLDGGGVRGVVELKILSRIEEEVGFGIKIQDMFDLVIGTSTGGIVALGVFKKGWTLTEATRRFRDLATQAFRFRRALKIPLYSTFAVPFCTFKYGSAGIVKALQESFEDDFLFGQHRGAQHSAGRGTPPSYQDQVKVGVVACVDGRNQPCLIANYSRNPLSDSWEPDILQREDEQEQDFQTWQAARATSAAHTFFKPYIHQPTRRTYVDGAVIRNNPVRIAFDESQKIWPSCNPDIIVSIGTGIMIDEYSNPVSTRSTLAENLKAIIPARLLKKAETGLNMVESTLDCQREWDDFKQSHGVNPNLRRNLYRIDVGLTEKPPKIDNVDGIGSLIDKSDKYLALEGGGRSHGGHQSMMVRDLLCIARRLRATLFCFSEPLTGNMAGRIVNGKIHCRLIPYSEGGSSLVASRLSFRLREVGPGHTERFYDVHRSKFDPTTMSADAVVQVSAGDMKRSIEVMIETRGQEWEPISGF